MDWQALQSQRLQAIGRSDVAAILALAERPDVISFAGGLPDPSTFLVDEVGDVAAKVFADTGRAALGYNPTPGVTPLREWLAERMTRMGRPAVVDEILVATGGVAALDLLAKALVDPGDVIVVGEPTYLAALHVFRSYQARFAGVSVDEHGMDPDALEATLGQLEREGVRPKLIYLVPSFQNPSGVTIPEGGRRRIVDVARAFGVPIVEDAAYRDLRYEGSAPPLLAALDPERVIHINTFSKFFNPGIRLGWVTAPRTLIDRLIVAKQGQDQCSTTFGQYICCAFARQGLFETQLDRAVDVYRQKRDTMLAALAAEMPAGTTWTRPEGGFYTWLSLPDRVDSDALLSVAVEREKVAYVPGPAFYHDGRGQRHLRLCYSYVASAAIAEGVARLAALFAGAMDAGPG